MQILLLYECIFHIIVFSLVFIILIFNNALIVITDTHSLSSSDYNERILSNPPTQYVFLSTTLQYLDLISIWHSRWFQLF